MENPLEYNGLKWQCLLFDMLVQIEYVNYVLYVSVKSMIVSTVCFPLSEEGGGGGGGGGGGSTCSMQKYPA